MPRPRSIIIICIALVWGCAAGARAEQVNPVYTADGRIAQAGKALWQRHMYGEVGICIDNDVIGSFTEIFNFGRSDTVPVFFMEGKQESHERGSSFSAIVRDGTDNDIKLGTYRQELSLQDDGLARIESVSKLDKPQDVKWHFIIMQMPGYLQLKGEYVKGDQRIPIGREELKLSADQLEGASIRFFNDDPEKSFIVYPVNCSSMTLSDRKMIAYPSHDGVLTLLLDIRGGRGTDQSAELSPNGIDFWQVDKLHLPDYAASRNMVQNPSFEAGFRYWALPTFASGTLPLRYDRIYEIDDTVAHSGKRSLRLKALAAPHPSAMGTFALPIVSGDTYTLSFYAKASRDVPLNLHAYTRGRLQHSLKNAAVTQEWQRFTVPVRLNERFISLYFTAQLTQSLPDDEAFVWVDDVQFEAGDSATEFTSASLTTSLVSAARGNFLEFGQAADFALNIHGAAGKAGSVQLAVSDFFGKSVFTGEYPFRTDAQGDASVPLGDLSQYIANQQFRGEFSVAGVFTLEGSDRSYKDFYRFSVMNFLDNTHRNKNIFNLTYVFSQQAGGPEMARYLERERAIGMGSIAYDFITFANDMDYDEDRERVELCEEYGFTFMGRPVLQLHGGENGEISERQGAVMMTNIKNRVDPTPEELAEFEAICELKAKSRPWNSMWWFTGESNPGVMPLEANAEAFAKFRLATLRGIKKGNPDAVVLVEGGPWNINPEMGTKWVERYIQDSEKLDSSAQFDGAAAHFYQNFPESPDLDAHVKTFIEMLDRNGKSHWPLYLNEGGNYAPFNIPQEGMSPYICHSANWWYHGPLSYHFGNAERIAAAFSARNWLIGLKYQSRVPCMQDFNTPNRYVDYDFTARPWEKIPNTLGRLLGNAWFYEDVRPAADVRCYIFIEDESGAPVAALWGCAEVVDRWKAEAPEFTFDFGQQNLTFIDLMENEFSPKVDASGKTVLAASPFPIFIRGEPGTEVELRNAIATAVSQSGPGAGINVSAYPLARGNMRAVITNELSRPYEGNIAVTVNDQRHEFSVDLDPLQHVDKSINLPPAPVNRRMNLDVSVDVDGANRLKAEGSYVLVPMQSVSAESWDAKTWKRVPPIALQPGASMRMRVTPRTVELAIEIEGSAKPSAETFAGTGLYIDPYGAPADWWKPRAVNQDLAVFELVGDGHSLQAFCHYVPGTQQGAGNHYLVADAVQQLITVLTEDDEESAWVMISIPREVLAPLNLAPGVRFGLNVALPQESAAPASLAPVSNFSNAREPGELNLLSVIVAE